ncbi:hypothetical protein MOOR_24010 [Moorella thermoacetica]|uniref:Uncharacterized protein n=1 Tax=Neomoorella thermoacetica TaxID=1525 RepID=A0A1J5JR75_NEOTH|nr:hypothetical protein MTJW_02380 [Moorella thermoacetica]OIQ07960.1 hypothetical protein MOOR_24010 [Moorella thermoacetica]
MGANAPATKDEDAGGDRGWRVQAEGDLVRGVSKLSEAEARRR